MWYLKGLWKRIYFSFFNSARPTAGRGNFIKRKILVQEAGPRRYHLKALLWIWDYGEICGAWKWHKEGRIRPRLENENSKFKLISSLNAYASTNLARPSDGRIITMNSRKMNVFRIIAWFRSDLVQWLIHWSDLITITGKRVANVHKSNVGIVSKRTAF